MGGSDPNAVPVSELTYLLMPGKCPKNFEYLKQYELAYAYWKAFWTHVYAEADSASAFVLDDFYRQDIICGIFAKDEVVALHLYSFFNLETQAVKDHHYFAFYPPSFSQYLRQNRSSLVMSMEFMTANPKWRKKTSGVSFAEVIGTCGLKVLACSEADAAIAPARKDVKVHEMAKRTGFDVWQENVVKRNFICDIIVGFRDRVHANEDLQVQRIADQLWTQRIDTTGVTWRPKLTRAQAA
jgi:hypothetical protein